MHPNMMHQGGMPQQQMHPDFYMMQQQGGQQRVPPMHMAPSQMQQVFLQFLNLNYDLFLVSINVLPILCSTLWSTIFNNDGHTIAISWPTALPTTNVESKCKCFWIF